MDAVRLQIHFCKSIKCVGVWGKFLYSAFEDMLSLSDLFTDMINHRERMKFAETVSLKRHKESFAQKIYKIPSLP